MLNFNTALLISQYSYQLSNLSIIISKINDRT